MLFLFKVLVIYHKTHKDLRKEPQSIHKDLRKGPQSFQPISFMLFLFKVLVICNKAHKDLRNEPKIQCRARVVPIDLLQIINECIRADHGIL